MIFIIVLTDEDLALFNKRDPKIVDKIYKEHKDKIYTFLIIKTRGNKEIADEVFCETFHSMMEAAPSLKSSNNIHAWLLQIASRRLNDFFRKKFREKKYFDNEVEDEKHLSSHDIHKNLESKEEILLLNSAMENLNDVHREIIKLKYIEKKSLKEIAQTYNISTVAINSKLERARQALKKEFKKLI